MRCTIRHFGEGETSTDQIHYLPLDPWTDVAGTKVKPIEFSPERVDAQRFQTLPYRADSWIFPLS